MRTARDLMSATYFAGRRDASRYKYTFEQWIQISSWRPLEQDVKKKRKYGSEKNSGSTRPMLVAEYVQFRSGRLISLGAWSPKTEKKRWAAS